MLIGNYVQEKNNDGYQVALVETATGKIVQPYAQNVDGFELEEVTEQPNSNVATICNGKYELRLWNTLKVLNWTHWQNHPRGGSDSDRLLNLLRELSNLNLQYRTGDEVHIGIGKATYFKEEATRLIATLESNAQSDQDLANASEDLRQRSLKAAY